MIYLSNAALRYAVDICLELPNYKVVICPEYQTDWDDIMGKITDYISLDNINVHKFVKNQSGDYYIEFTTGSIIRFVLASDSRRGYRANLVIVDSKIDEDIINAVLRPKEIIQLIEKR